MNEKCGFIWNANDESLLRRGVPNVVCWCHRRHALISTRARRSAPASWRMLCCSSATMSIATASPSICGVIGQSLARHCQVRLTPDRQLQQRKEDIPLKLRRLLMQN